MVHLIGIGHLIFAELVLATARVDVHLLAVVQDQIVQATARVDVRIFTVVTARLSRMRRYHRIRSIMLK